MRETGIFTGTTISLCLSLRQLPDRYAIRAGRNLPDKEFRYLRTVIVTAAIHWGFDSQLRLAADHSSSFQHWAGVSPHTSSSRLCGDLRSEEHTSELQSHSFISYAVFCLKKKYKKSQVKPENNSQSHKGLQKTGAND